MKPFEMHIYVRATADQVLQAWINSDQITKWFVTDSEYRDASGAVVNTAVEGGTFRWRWIEGSEDSSQILRAGPGAFWFGWDQGKGQVQVRIESLGSESRVTLKQEMFEGSPDHLAQFQLGCRLGWTFFLTNLKAWLEHGVDLREKRPERSGALNV